MTDYLIDRSADRFREPAVSEAGGNGLLHVNYMVVTNTVELFRAYPRHDIFAD